MQRTRKSPEERSGNLLFGKLSLAKTHPYCIFSAVWAKNPLNELRAKEEKVHRDWLAALVKECLDKFGSDAVQYLAPKVHLVTGSPRHVILEQVEVLRPDLMVIGSIARTGLPGFLMVNTAEAILDEVDCSVTTVKPPGFESPIHL